MLAFFLVDSRQLSGKATDCAGIVINKRFPKFGDEAHRSPPTSSTIDKDRNFIIAD